MTPSSEGYFESIGADWDRLQQSFFSERVRDVALSVAGVNAGSLAADLGAGTGFITQALLKKGLSVVAVDQSPAMLDALRSKWPAAEQLCTRVGDAEHLPIDSELVDYAFANMYLHHVENPLLAIAEMARILKPGGKLVVTDVDTHDFEFFRKEHHDRWLGFEREHVHCWFRDVGLSGVKVDCAGENCCTDSEDGTHAALSIFIASGTKPTNVQK